MTTRTILCCAFATLAGSAIAAPDLSKLPPASKQTGITYTKDIKPLFEASCTRCHGSERQKGDLRLDSLEAVLKGGKDGDTVIPGKSDKSALVIAAARIDDETAMPPTRKGRGPKGPGGQGGPGGPGGFGGPPPRPDGQGGGQNGGPGGAGGPGQGFPPPQAGPGNQGSGQGGQGNPPPTGRDGGPGGPGFHGPPGGGAPAKPLTADQVGLLRAWIDQGAK